MAENVEALQAPHKRIKRRAQSAVATLFDEEIPESGVEIGRSGGIEERILEAPHHGVGGAVNEGSMERFPERRPRIQARPKTQTGTQHREAATDVEQREGADFLGMSQRILQSDRGTDAVPYEKRATALE